MSVLSFLFSRRDTSPPDVAVDELSASDPYDMVPEEPADPDFILANMRLGLAYKDERGARTKRIIRLKRLDASPYFSYLHAFCELRKEDRMFRVDRMSVLYDPATGEVLGDGETYFGPYIERAIQEEERQIEKSQFRGAWQIIEAMRDELSILVLVARADGRFVKAEREMLLRYTTTRAGDLGISVSDEELAVLAKWIQVQDPSEPEARLAVRRLASKEGALDAIWQVSELIAEADGKVREQERRAFAEIRTAIAAMTMT